MAVRVRLTLTQARVVKATLESQAAEDVHTLEYMQRTWDYAGNKKRRAPKPQIKRLEARSKHRSQALQALVKEIQQAEAKIFARSLNRKKKHVQLRVAALP